MKYRRFGRTELSMPVFSCGGMRFQFKWQDVAPNNIPRKNQQSAKIDYAQTSPSAVKLVNRVIYDAAKSGASAVHIEPDDPDVSGLRIRYRIDGRLSACNTVSRRQQEQELWKAARAWCPDLTDSIAK